MQESETKELMATTPVPPDVERKGIQVFEYLMARAMLMTGPKATPPTWRAIRKTIGRLRRGDAKRKGKPFGSWRDAPRIKARG